MKALEEHFSISVPMLRTLVDVIDRGGITAAARTLHLSQSAASTHVASLAKLAGGPLLQRRDGKLVPTHLGHIMYESGNDILDRVANLRARLRRETASHASVLALAASHAACEATLAAVLRGFELFAPDVRVNVEIHNAVDVERRLCDGTVDVVLVEGKPEIRDAQFTPYFSSRVRVAMHPDHALASSEVVTIANLSEYRLIALKRLNATQRFVERALGEHVTELHPEIELESNEALVACIEAGLGIGFVSEATLKRPLALHTLVASDLRDVDLTRTFAFGYRTDRDRSNATQQFIAWLDNVRIES